MKFAAIDVGSNAVRLLVSRIDETGENPLVKKEVLLRIPIRLGQDVFQDNTIGPERATKLIKTMEAFRNLLDVFQPLGYRACATSAMRDAANGQDVVQQILDQTGIELEIITGQREAEIIFSSHVERQLDPDLSYLFIDVGGGSTELMLYSEAAIVASQSFNIGSVRILNNKDQPEEWQKMEDWVRSHVQKVAPLGIGSGGNISRLNRIAGKDETSPLSLRRLGKVIDELSDMSVEGRIRRYKLKPDRADVIVPAGRIYQSVMEWGDIQKIYVPKFGLADGLVRLQYDDWRDRNIA